MLRPFKLHEPTSMEEAIRLLGEYGDEAKIYAGGTELLLAMKEGLLRYGHLVNVKTVEGLNHLAYDDDSGVLSIGSTVTHRVLEDSAEVREHFPLIASAESKVANVRVRNVGTIGGNLCFAEPHSDPATFLLLYDAQLEVAGPAGRRTLPVAGLTLGPFETCLEEDELLARVLVPRFPHRMAGAYLKFGYHPRPSLGLGVAVKLDDAADEAVVQEVRVAVGSAGPRAVRAPEAEELIKGRALAELLGNSSQDENSLLNRAGRLAAEAAEPVDDLHGSAEYKEHLVGVLLRRALLSAIEEGWPQETLR